MSIFVVSTFNEGTPPEIIPVRSVIAATSFANVLSDLSPLIYCDVVPVVITGSFSVSSSFIAACTVVAAILPAGVFATVVAVWSPVFAPETVVVPVTARVGVEVPEIATVLYLPAVISPVVSAIVAALFCMSFPVVESKRAIALSVAEAGQTTSPDHFALICV